MAIQKQNILHGSVVQYARRDSNVAAMLVERNAVVINPAIVSLCKMYLVFFKGLSSLRENDGVKL